MVLTRSKRKLSEDTCEDDQKKMKLCGKSAKVTIRKTAAVSKGSKATTSMEIDIDENTMKIQEHKLPLDNFIKFPNEIIERILVKAVAGMVTPPEVLPVARTPTKVKVKRPRSTVTPLKTLKPKLNYKIRLQTLTLACVDPAINGVVSTSRFSKLVRDELTQKDPMFLYLSQPEEAVLLGGMKCWCGAARGDTLYTIEKEKDNTIRKFQFYVSYMKASNRPVVECRFLHDMIVQGLEVPIYLLALPNNRLCILEVIDPDYEGNKYVMHIVSAVDGSRIKSVKLGVTRPNLSVTEDGLICRHFWIKLNLFMYFYNSDGCLVNVGARQQAYENEITSISVRDKECAVLVDSRGFTFLANTAPSIRAVALQSPIKPISAPPQQPATAQENEREPENETEPASDTELENESEPENETEQETDQSKKVTSKKKKDRKRSPLRKPLKQRYIKLEQRGSDQWHLWWLDEKQGLLTVHETGEYMNIYRVLDV